MGNEIINTANENVCELSSHTGLRTNYTVRVLRTFQEVETVRAAWTQWQTHPTCDIDHYLLVCRIRSNVRRPHVVVVYEQHKIRALLVARLEDGYIAPSIGYLQPVRMKVTQLAFVYQGLLGHIDDAVTTTMLGALRASLSTGEAVLVNLYHLDEHSPLLHAALKRVSSFFRDTQPTWSTHWELTLPDKPGGLLQKMSSKHRYWIRRKARDLENAFPGRVSYRAFASTNHVADLCAELETVARMTYQRSLDSGFVNDTDHRERFSLFQRRGALRAWTLSIEDRPCAFCVGCLYQDTFYFSETGYAPDLRSYEIGTLIFLHMADELIKEGVAKFNFGFGDAYYKQRFGDHSWREATLRIYAPTFKGLTARYLTGCTDAVTDMGRWLVRRLGALEVLKTAWRRRLADKAKHNATVA